MSNRGDTSFKARLKGALPAPLWRAARESWNGLGRLALLPEATLHPWRRTSIARLAAYRDRHRGQRAFIIGNGPSLKCTDLSLLRDEVTFGLNRFYLMFPELGFTSTYLLTINSLVVEQCAAEIAALPLPKFISWRSRRWFSSLPDDLMFLHTTYTVPGFAPDARGRLWEGATVTYVALQLAFYMGFETVILIGVDHSFSTTGQPNTTVVSQGDDPDHFNPGYFGKGFRWQLPDLATSERSYALARDAYAAAGRQVLDATVDGKLTIFPKVAYRELF
jgi:hypothetical protein